MRPAEWVGPQAEGTKEQGIVPKKLLVGCKTEEFIAKNLSLIYCDNRYFP